MTRQYLPTRPIDTCRAGCSMLAQPCSVQLLQVARPGPECSSNRGAISSTPWSAAKSHRALVYAAAASRAVITASIFTSQNSAIFSFISSGIARSLRHSRISGWIPMARSPFHAVLRGLGLSTPRRGDPGDQGDVHEQSVFSAWCMAQLADRFEEGKRPPISPTVPPISTITTSRRAAPEDRLLTAPGYAPHRGLDFVSDVRDHHLHRVLPR